MGVLDGSPYQGEVRIAPGKQTDLIALYCTTDGGGDVTSINGYTLAEVPVSRSGGQYTFNIGIFRNVLGCYAAATGDPTAVWTKVGDDNLRVTFAGAVTTGYISFVAFVEGDWS